MKMNIVEKQVCLVLFYVYSILIPNTDHFTSFALLLNGNSNGDGCGETNLDTVILWLSLAAVGLALIAICIGLILVEIRIRYNNLQKEKEFMKIEDRIQENSNTN